MNKEINIKTQSIVPNAGEIGDLFSGTFELQPENQTLTNKKGTLYVAYDLRSTKQLEENLLTKVVADVLRERYFLSDSASPVQALEKAILTLRDNLQKLAGDSIDFNIASAIIWGPTLYLVQYGNSRIHIMRDAKIKPFEGASEGRFSVASGAISENDIVVLQTKDFFDSYPPEKLLSTTQITQENLKAGQSCMIIKIDIERNLSAKEQVNFNNQPQKKEEQQPQEKTLPAATTSNKPQTSQETKTKEKSKLTAKIIIGANVLLAIALAVFTINFVLKNKTPKPQVESAQDDRVTLGEIIPRQPQQEKEEQKEPAVDTSQDQERKIERQKGEIIYDLQLINPEIETTEITFAQNRIVITDTTGKIYYADANKPQFKQADVQFAGIKSLFSTNGVLGFIDNEGYKNYNLSLNEVTDFYGNDSILGVTTAYLDFIYSADTGTITKYALDNKEASPTIWTSDKDIKEPVGIGIDVSIFVLNASGEILKFTTGEEEVFETEELQIPVTNAVAFYTTVDTENMYILDQSDSRIVILTKEGELVKQIKIEREFKWDNLRGFGINESGGKAYVLNGTTVYEVDL